MNKRDFKDFFNRAFGKEKDEKTHAIAMLAIYGIFILILIVFVRLNGGKNTNETTNKNTDNKEIVEPTTIPTPKPKEEPKKEKIESDINYSYSYTTMFDGVTEVYLGKRIDDKQKFSYVKDGITNEYAIKDGNYLMYNGNVYYLVDKLDTYFRYCDVEKILDLVDNSIPTSNGNIVNYRINNKEIAEIFNEKITIDNETSNIFTLNIENDVLKSVKLDLTNYISSLLGTTHTLTINMDFANIGTTEDFDIKLN